MIHAPRPLPRRARAAAVRLRRGVRRRARRGVRAPRRRGTRSRSPWPWSARSARWSRPCCSPAPARSPPAVRSPSTAPALFLQATIAGLGALAILLFAERALDPARSSFVPSAAVPAGSPRDRRAADLRARADRGLPAGHVRHRRHDAVRRGERPAGHVRRARGAQPAAVPDQRPGPPPAAALAGGGGQVLPAGRVRLGVLPLRPGPGLRRHRQRPARRHPRRGRRRRQRTSCSSSGWPCWSSA